MLDQSQTCPSCRSSKYSNPQLRLMVNTCGHSLCENCVEVLFVRGSGLCVQCKTPIRKVNFRYQLFEDPLVQKEVEIRKKILSDFNKREDDFDTLEEYDLYLEKIEELVYNLMNDIDVEECKRYIENYKKENKDIIKKNRLRPSASMLFYDAELEREAMLREKREKEDEERRQNLLRTAAPGTSNGPTNGISERPDQSNLPLAPPSSYALPDVSRFLPPSTTIIKPPSTARPQPPSQFYSPASMATTAARGLPSDRMFIPPPSSALGGGFRGAVPPSAALFAPPSSMCPPSASNWTGVIAPSHNQVILPPKAAQSSRPPDSVVMPNRSASSSRPSNRQDKHAPPAFTYTPFEFDLFGPPVPNPAGSRWTDILDVYTGAIIDRLRDASKPEPGPDHKTPLDRRQTRSATAASHKIEEPDVKRTRSSACGDSWAAKMKKEEDEAEQSETGESAPSVGLSHQLPSGACGIAPIEFLERCLQESRCALYM